PLQIPVAIERLDLFARQRPRILLIGRMKAEFAFNFTQFFGSRNELRCLCRFHFPLLYTTSRPWQRACTTLEVHVTPQEHAEVEQQSFDPQETHGPPTPFLKRPRVRRGIAAILGVTFFCICAFVNYYIK